MRNHREFRVKLPVFSVSCVIVVQKASPLPPVLFACYALMKVELFKKLALPPHHPPTTIGRVTYLCAFTKRLSKKTPKAHDSRRTCIRICVNLILVSRVYENFTKVYLVVPLHKSAIRYLSCRSDLETYNKGLWTLILDRNRPKTQHLWHLMSSSVGLNNTSKRFQRRDSGIDFQCVLAKTDAP